MTAKNVLHVGQHAKYAGQKGQMMTKLEQEDTIACWRCEEQTPMSEMIAVHAEWVCGVCYDDL